MARHTSEEIKQQWKDRIQNQRQSGHSIPTWCKENKITFSAFNYWKGKLFPKESPNRTSFLEITEKDLEKKPAIIIEYQDFRVLINSEFNPVTLKECLKTLREAC